MQSDTYSQHNADYRYIYHIIKFLNIMHANLIFLKKISTKPLFHVEYSWEKSLCIIIIQKEKPKP